MIAGGTEGPAMGSSPPLHAPRGLTCCQVRPEEQRSVTGAPDRRNSQTGVRDEALRRDLLLARATEAGGESCVGRAGAVAYR